MGSWGIGLYQDDSAADVRDMISLLAKLPVSGDRLLEIILDNYQDNVGLNEDGGPTFWLVVADQFERRGIPCRRAFEQALKAIDTGADLRDLEARDAGEKDLKKRAKLLETLAPRFREPRPARPRPSGKRLPPMVVAAGEVYRFPTMQDKAFNPYLSSWERFGFKPDGWGAMLIFACGRAFDWFPWFAGSGLTVDATRPPSLDDAIQSRFIAAEQRGSYMVPRKRHLERMPMELIGRLDLDPRKVAKVMPRRDFPPERAAVVGWTFVPEARSWRGPPGDGPLVSDLLK